MSVKIQGKFHLEQLKILLCKHLVHFDKLTEQTNRQSCALASEKVIHLLIHLDFLFLGRTDAQKFIEYSHSVFIEASNGR